MQIQHEALRRKRSVVFDKGVHPPPLQLHPHWTFYWMHFCSSCSGKESQSLSGPHRHHRKDTHGVFVFVFAFEGNLSVLSSHKQRFVPLSPKCSCKCFLLFSNTIYMDMDWIYPYYYHDERDVCQVERSLHLHREHLATEPAFT